MWAATFECKPTSAPDQNNMMHQPTTLLMDNDQEVSTHLPSAKEKHHEVWSTLLSHNSRKNQKCKAGEKNSIMMQEGSISTTPVSREWPDLSLSHVSNSDYNDILHCPHDIRFFKNDEQSAQGKKSKTTVQSKALCPHGAVCCAEIHLFPQSSDVTHPPYTGLLTPNTTVKHCILRLSSVGEPPAIAAKSRIARGILHVTGDKLRNATLFPMVAVKAFRDGNNVRSGNLLFGGCKVGQPETNFFEHCLCTQLTERIATPIKPFVRKFWTYSDYPLSLGISDFCSMDRTGKKATRLDGGDGVTEDEGINHFPFILILRPVYNNLASKNQHGDENSSSGQNYNDLKKNESKEERMKRLESFDSFLDDLLSIPPGSALYDIFACPEPEAVVDPTKLERIGQIITASDMILSPPDDGLFFRHQRKEEDFELRPEWKDAIKVKCSPDGGKTIGTVSQLAGWELFEGAIKKGGYVDFENAR